MNNRNRVLNSLIINEALAASLIGLLIITRRSSLEVF
jgi:hypothetical protein